MSSILNNFKQGYVLMMKTLPYIWMRVLIYGVYGLGATIYFIITLYLAKYFGKAGSYVMLIALGLFGGFYYWSKRYLLYMVKAGHVALFTEIHNKGELETGVGQFQYGKELVNDRIKEISVLFALDALIDGILRTFSRSVAMLADFLPIPGIENMAKIGTTIINRSLSYVDEAIFSYSILNRDKNLWQSSKDGVILYAQSWQELLKTAVTIWLADKLFVVLAFVSFLLPFGLLAFLVPSLKGVFIISAMVLAILADAALFEPLALATMIVTFQDAVKDQVPNPEWEKKLEAVSSQFKELKDKALNTFSEGAHKRNQAEKVLM